MNIFAFFIIWYIFGLIGGILYYCAEWLSGEDIKNSAILYISISGLFGFVAFGISLIVFIIELFLNAVENCNKILIKGRKKNN